MSLNAQKIWSQYEHQVLKAIVLEKKITKWNLVSKILHQQYQIQGFTAKQCRQQWNNSKESNANIQPWTNEQEEKLYYYHNLYGNKWAKISNFITGRSDNCIKNHFYSTLRKAFRGINKFINRNKKTINLKPFKNGILGKIINFAQQAVQKKIEIFSSQTLQNNCIDASSRCIKLKNQLMKIARKSQQQESQKQQFQNIINEIISILKFQKSRKLKQKKKAQVCQKIQIQIKKQKKQQFQNIPIKKSSFKAYQFKKDQKQITQKIPNTNQKKSIQLQTMTSLPYIPSFQTFYIFPNNSYLQNNMYDSRYLNIPYIGFNQFYDGMNSIQLPIINNMSVSYANQQNL